MHLRKFITLGGAHFLSKKSIEDSELRLSTKTEFASALGIGKNVHGYKWFIGLIVLLFHQARVKYSIVAKIYVENIYSYTL